MKTPSDILDIVSDPDRCPAALRDAVVRLAAECGRRHLLFGTAESCTGGLIGATATDVPGISEVFAGGIVSYSNEVKERCLGVPHETLEAHGAVSAETAHAMADGACRALGCGAAVSVTGIAGPGGAVPGKPVGTVYIGVSVDGSATARRFDWGAELPRATIRLATVLAALEMLSDAVSRACPRGGSGVA